MHQHISENASKSSKTVKQAIIDLLLPFVDQTLTITCDNGKEFAKHIAIAQALDANVFLLIRKRPGSWEPMKMPIA